jgi:hypothetical protein
VFLFFLSYIFTHLARTGVPVARLGANYGVRFRRRMD